MLVTSHDYETIFLEKIPFSHGVSFYLDVPGDVSLLSLPAILPESSLQAHALGDALK